MKVLIAQTNTTPRDFAGNIAQIKEAITMARASNPDLIVTPELSIPGYSVKDLIYGQDFVEKNLKALQEIILLTRGLPQTQLIVGYIDRNRKGFGKPYRNMAAVIQDGMLIATYQKQLLPFYDVFDEGRYFEPGEDLTVITVKDQRFGICICEDLWNDKNIDNYNYAVNPVQKYRSINVNNIISINSSPFVYGKAQQKQEIFKKITQSYNILIYCNQVGGQDDLVFDGRSTILYGHKQHTLAFGHPEYALIDAFDLPATQQQVNNPSIEEIYQAIILGISDYVSKSGFDKVVVGSSGGIDSALVLALACEAIGADKVHAIRMPSVYSSEHSVKDAKELHDNLHCHDYLNPISHENLLQHFNEHLVTNLNYNLVANENIQARLRGLAVMHFSNAYRALALTTGNKSELSVGYCTLYGDCNGGLAPLGDLWKTQVYQLAKYCNRHHTIIPTNIIEKAPSAELAPGQFDEKSLLPYEILDNILQAYIENNINDYFTWSKSSGLITTEADYKRIISLVDNNEFKRRQLAPCIKISNKAFGTGRRMPIVKK